LQRVTDSNHIAELSFDNTYCLLDSALNQGKEHLAMMGLWNINNEMKEENIDTTSMFSKIHEIKGLSRENCQNSYTSGKGREYEFCLITIPVIIFKLVFYLSIIIMRMWPSQYVVL